MRFYEYRSRPVAETAGHVIAWLTPRHPCIEVPKEVLAKATEMDVNDWRHRFGTTVAEAEEAYVHALRDVLDARNREPSQQLDRIRATSACQKT